VKFLGRIISESLFDATEVRSFCEAVFSSLVAIDKCQLRGVQKVLNGFGFAFSRPTIFFLAQATFSAARAKFYVTVLRRL